jgi:hypothetical protein
LTHGRQLLCKAGQSARCAQHAAGNLDNHHGEILCAASARVNVSVFYQSFDTANQPWPTSIVLAAGSSRSGSAWLGRSQKDGLPSRSRGVSWRLRLKAINSRTGEGQLGCCPFKLGASARPRRTRDGSDGGNNKPRLPHSLRAGGAHNERKAQFRPRFLAATRRPKPRWFDHYPNWGSSSRLECRNQKTLARRPDVLP